jgi:NhaP-type Na+/H+ or K+/H+ antiporter
MEDAIAFLLIGTVILVFVCAMMERYWRVLLVLTGEVLLAGLAIAVVATLSRLAWVWFCHWLELRQIRTQAARAIQRTNDHYEKSRADMEQLTHEYRLRKEIDR